MNLAALLEEMGERAEARRLYEEVVAGETAQLGPAHTSTLRTKYNLATLLACCRRWGNLKKPCCCSRRTGSDRLRRARFGGAHQRNTHNPRMLHHSYLKILLMIESIYTLFGE